MAAKTYRINYKSDFILTLRSDAGWTTPFCIKFWTDMPSRAYYAQYDGETYTHCAVDSGDPTSLTVQFDDHGMGVGDLQFQIAYHFTMADFPEDTEDEVLNQESVTVDVDGEEAQVVLDFNGETAPEIAYSLPAYANEAARVEAEAARVEAEAARVEAEVARVEAEVARVEAEAARVEAETARVSEFSELKTDAQAVILEAEQAATIALEKATAADTAAQTATTAATQAVSVANDAAVRAMSVANTAAANADEKATEAEQAAAAAGNVDATAEGTVITVTNRQGVSTSVDVNDVMLALIGINGILDEINGEII